MHAFFAWFAPVSCPVLIFPLVLGASSIASLLIYFYGLMSMGESAWTLLLPGVVVLAGVMLWAYGTRRVALLNRILAGIWAGALATMMYDLVRVPIVWSGVPVFKAISYFGTIILGQSAPSVPSEIVGWAYHLSNGIGFGLMYTALFSTPRLWTAVLWGLILEGVMLMTPYAEVFGYRLSPMFLTVTIGAHVVYGITLWAALRYWFVEPPTTIFPQQRWRSILLASVITPIGIGTAALDFHMRHAEAMPSSPPGYIGSHLYTTWNVLEPDRLAALWVLKRFVNPHARLHFIAPFSHIDYGTPFDMPEAMVRRRGMQSVTEDLLAQHNLQHEPRLKLLAEMAYLYEITPWMRPTHPAAHQLGQDLIEATGHCEPTQVSNCVERARHFLDKWYAHAGTQDDSK